MVKNWKKRFFILKGDNLYYFRGKQDIQAAGMIPIDDCRSFPTTTPNKYSFEIATKGRTYHLYADSQVDMNEWLNALGKLKTESQSSISQMKDEKLILNIKCLMCERCEERVKQILSLSQGVLSFEVDTKQEKATLFGNILGDQITNSLEDAGFIVTRWKEE